MFALWRRVVPIKCIENRTEATYINLKTELLYFPEFTYFISSFFNKVI